MGLFVTDPIGLIIAFLNVATFTLLVYVFLKAVEERSRLLHVLDRIYGPILVPLRRILPAWRVDIAPLILAALLQAIVFILKRRIS